MKSSGKKLCVLVGMAYALFSFGDALDDAIQRAKDRYKNALVRIDQLERSYRMLEGKLLEEEGRENVPAVCEGRLTSSVNTNVMMAALNNQRRLFFSPDMGDKISVYYSGKWRLHTFTQLSIDLNNTAAAANSIYDVFAYRNNSGTLSLQISAAWASSTTRTDALGTQDGVTVLASDSSRRYLGSFKTDTSNAAPNERIDDNFVWRGIWNNCNRVPRALRIVDASNTWSYLGTAWRQAGADVLNDVQFLIGLSEDPVISQVKTAVISTDNTTRNASVGIGVDSNTVNSAFLMGGAASRTAATQISIAAKYMDYPGIGWHRFAWIESCDGCADATNATFFGDGGNAGRMRSGILAWVWQ